MKNCTKTAIWCLALITSKFSAAQSPSESAIKVPEGFKVKVVAELEGRPRHIVSTSNGDLYVKLKSLQGGEGIVFLQDKDRDGKFEKSATFGDYIGTGITIKDNYLYASSNSEVFRYKLNSEGEVINPAEPEKIITGLIDRRQHETKSIVLDDAGNIYVNIGAYSNSCQIEDRKPGSPGRPNCPILDSAGGIWQFKADKLNQSYQNGVRYATGLRNVMGLDWNKQDNSLYVMQHGRDQLNMFPQYFSNKESAELPAECMYKIKKGDNAGWPYIYYDHIKHKKMLAPEYGGDGKKEGDSKYIDPVVAFPGHLAPNALLFYTGNQFPERYKNGAFIAFHGSWNRSPEPQQGYFVAFVPFKDGQPSGNWEIFANGFSGVDVVSSPRQAEHRPCGLTQGPDGSIFVSDDAKGTIFKISYTKTN